MGIWLRLPRAQILASAIYRKVLYPEVKAFTFTMTRAFVKNQGGLRRFNRCLSPAIRYHNVDIEYKQVYPQGDAIKSNEILIEFKDGSTTTYDANGKDSIDIFNELITAAKGVSYIPKSVCNDVQLPAPVLTQDPKTI